MNSYIDTNGTLIEVKPVWVNIYKHIDNNHSFAAGVEWGSRQKAILVANGLDIPESIKYIGAYKITLKQK